MRVGQVDVPSHVKVSYVRGWHPKGVFWYLVSWDSFPDGAHRSFPVTSEEEAKSNVLSELRRSLAPPGAN